MTKIKVVSKHNCGNTTFKFSLYFIVFKCILLSSKRTKSLLKITFESI